MSELNNKLIAEFMGLVQNPSDPRSFGFNVLEENGKIVGAEWWKIPLYHNSWDWLMPVVDKIESIDLKDMFYTWDDEEDGKRYNFEGISVEIENNRCWIYGHMALDPYWTFNEKTFRESYSSKIEATYNAIVEFINWYNKKTKS